MLKAVFTHTTASERVTIEYGNSVEQFVEDNAHAAVWLGECGACLLSVSSVALQPLITLHLLTHSLSPVLVLVVVMGSMELKTSRSLMLIL